MTLIEALRDASSFYAKERPRASVCVLQTEIGQSECEGMAVRMDNAADVIEQLWGNLAAARRYVHAYTENENNHPQARDNANSLIHQIDTSIAKLK